MRRSFAVLALSIAVCFTSLAQSKPPSSSASSNQDDVTAPPLTVPKPDHSQVPKSGEGNIVISFRVMQDGAVTELVPLYNEPFSMNFVNSVHPELQQSALAAVKAWKYPPLLIDGKPVGFKATVVLLFKFQQPAETLQQSLAAAAPSSSSPRDANGIPASFRALSRIGLDQETISAMQTKHVEPEYPQIAKLAHIQGDVVVHLIISKEGHVANATAVSGHPILIQSVMAAVTQWEYKPLMMNGEPMGFQSNITVKFHI